MRGLRRGRGGGIPPSAISAAPATILAALVLTGCHSFGRAWNGHAGHRHEHRYAARLLGHDGYQMGCLRLLWDQESGWDPYAVNQQSGAYGIPQSLGHGHPFDLGDWRAQIRWGLHYIAQRYGSPCSAWGHEQADGWY